MLNYYDKAINETKNTISKRAKNYRSLVIIVVIIGLGSVIWLLISLSLTSLSNLLLLIPACGLFFLLDTKLLNKWRSNILDTWSTGEIDLFAFNEAVKAIPNLPKNSATAMLSSLPISINMIEEHNISTVTRSMMANTINTSYKLYIQKLIIKLAGISIVVISILLAVFLSSWLPLISLIAVLPLKYLSKQLNASKLAEHKTLYQNNKKETAFDENGFQNLLNYVNWGHISQLEKEKLFRAS